MQWRLAAGSDCPLKSPHPRPAGRSGHIIWAEDHREVLDLGKNVRTYRTRLPKRSRIIKF